MNAPAIQVNMHHPRVDQITRLPHGSGVVVDLGDGTLLGGRAVVTLFLGNDPDHVQGFIDQLAQSYRDLIAWEADGHCQGCDAPGAKRPLCANCRP